MSDNPHANGGLLRRTEAPTSAMPTPDARAQPGRGGRVAGAFLRDVMKLNLESKNFRLFSPTRTTRTAGDVLDVTIAATSHVILPEDDHLSPTAASWRC
jgi:xylulose-5-phosphate/fructose-6-phosphate phosphoketolase